MNENSIEDISVVEKEQGAKGFNSLVKLSRKSKKKVIVDELSFVEHPVDTFYLGIKDENQIQNPVAFGRSILVDEADEEWIHPDTQLVKSHRKQPKMEKRLTNRTPLRSTLLPQSVEPQQTSNKYRCLTFVDAPKLNETSRSVARGAIADLFDDRNPALNQRDSTSSTPRKSKVLVDDTPEIFYGLSIIERRHKGINF